MLQCQKIQVVAVYRVRFDSCWFGRLWTPKTNELPRPLGRLWTPKKNELPRPLGRLWNPRKNGLPQPLALQFFVHTSIKYLLANTNQQYILQCIIVPNLWQNWPLYNIYHLATKKIWQKTCSQSPALYFYVVVTGILVVVMATPPSL